MNIHFVGVGGIGMSALAQLHAMSGDRVSGSDRLLSRGYADLRVFKCLEELGVKVYPQDGSAISEKLDLIVVSSAIEADNPELKRAAALGIKVIHRSDLLASHVAEGKTIAISGTSGKSTVTAMVFEILTAAGLAPSVITGATLLSLQEQGLYGNVYKGKSDILVIEADESDGSLVRYHPEIGVCLNIQKDHKEIDVLKDFFKTFYSNSKKFLALENEPNAQGLFPNAQTFGLSQITDLELTGRGSFFTLDGQKFKLNLIGEHNVLNALAAIAAAREVGVSLQMAADVLGNFKGVYRRYNIVGSVNGIDVVDDFAHNPHKLAAVLKASQLRGGKVLAFFQPHAFASVKLLKNEFIEEIASALREQDRFWLTGVYYAGGTVDRSSKAEDIFDGLKEKGLENVYFDSCRENILKEIVKSAKKGDTVLVLGARDPSLTDFAKKIFKNLQKEDSAQQCSKCMSAVSCLGNQMNNEANA